MGSSSAPSEFDAAALLGCNPDQYGQSCQGRTAVSRGHDFLLQNVHYQVKANRPSGKKRSTVTLVNKVANYDWDILIWILYDRHYNIVEAWSWSVRDYRAAFESVNRISPKHMRQGKRLFPHEPPSTNSSTCKHPNPAHP